MEFVYNFLIVLVVLVVLLGFVGLIRPSIFQKMLGNKATRRNILLYSIGLFIALVLIAGFTEPASVKQARLEKDRIAQLAKQKQEEQKAKDEQLKATKGTKQTKEQPKKVQPAPNPRYYWHQVISVVDGDTVKAKVDGKEESIRVIGIDAPESTTSHECYGTEASAKAKEFLNGKWIQLEADNSQSNRDKYGRLLRYVWFDNGTDFGRRMMEEGYAYEYTYSTPYNKQSQYKETQEYSKSKQFGLWSPKTCNGQKQAPIATPAPKPTPTAPIATQPSSNCDPNYTPCIKYVPGNTLNCPDIGVMVHVIGVDHNKFDANGDGYGCESYQ